MEIGESFLGKTLAELVALYGNNRAIKELWDAAKATHEKLKEGKLKWQTNCDVRGLLKCGAELSNSFWFLKLSEFLQLFKYEPKVLQCSIVTVKDELGVKDVRGVVVKPSSDQPLHRYRVIRFFHQRG